MDNLLIRVDSTYEIGMGHFMRTLALAQKWQQLNGEIFFLINDNDILKEKIISQNMHFIVNPHISGSIDDSNFLIKQINNHDISWVVVDGYIFKEEYFANLRNNNVKFLIFDDDGKLNKYVCNIVLNQNLHGNEDWYIPKKEDYTQLLIGTDYVLLRNEFLEFIDYKKSIKDVVKNILVTLGGSDVNNYSLKILKILNKLDYRDFNVIVVIGANNIHEEELQSFSEISNFNVQILKNVSNMPELMELADLAFSSGGTTVWELAFMGVPTIVGATSYIEEVLLDGLNENNLFKTVGNLENLNENFLLNLFNDLIMNYNERSKMSIDGQNFIDGFGFKRILNNMR
ncbi:UDP-2,4-diacetamido-2,4,6-trideoxy-beta-L-altropyranose hydrolase [uncultured Methanobrevibacter sp.]|uniref:UDP-2,4-diacetamido-2,4, 6-trideoxy-beta-L-altropyranose hydrolase n=1 Tax=uncultured Methanobrevibacter sp. TaxID=253161 RepID=UPI0025D29D5C|nr:UDP-2,4-diacetamido-2,4,6-trideoxy-beta-L-altropyranose hydrolase [uncultured Methanobrevibacter sp.]